MSFVSYPEAPVDFSPRERQAWNLLLEALGRRDKRTFSGSSTPTGTKWALANVSLTYSLDPVAANTSAVGHVLGTLLTDLQKKGIIS